MVFLARRYFFLFFCLLGELAAFPRVVARQQYLDLLDQEPLLDWRTLLELSLDASGVQNRGPYLAKFAVYIDDLNKLLEPLDDEYEKGEVILSYMFHFLGRYDLLQTRLDVMFDHASYNCVSSAVLYVALARAFGFEARGVGTHNHAFVELSLADGRHIDVETTSRYGFDPGHKKEFFDTFTATTGLVYVPKQSYAKRNSLNDAEFISLILQNRLYILNQNNRNFRVLEQMIPLAADLATLTQADRDIQNFFSMVSEYVFQLSQRGEVQPALDFTDLVRDTYGKLGSLGKVRNAIAHNDVLAFIENQDYAGAKERLAYYTAAGLLNSDSSATLRHSLRSQQLEILVNSSTVPFAQKLAAVQSTAEMLASRQLEKLYQVIYGNEVYGLLADGFYGRVAELLDNYPAAFRSRPFYRKILADSQNAHIVNIYNKSVTQINKGAYREAEQLVAEGLDFYPDNASLRNLRSRLLQIAGR